MDSRDELIGRLTRFYREAGGEVSSVPPAWVPGRRRTVPWLQPVLASLALVALAIGLAVTFRMAEEANHTKILPAPSLSPSASVVPSPSPSPSRRPTWVTRQVPLGEVTTMSLDSSAIFALYAPTPVSGGIDPSKMKLARIDRATGAMAKAGDFPFAKSVVRVAAGLWVAAGPGIGDGTPAADTNWLSLLDPVTLSVRQRVHLPGQAGALTSGPQLAGTADLLWLAYGSSLYRLDPATGRVLLTQSLPGSSTSLSIDPSSRRLYTGVLPGRSANSLVVELDGSTGSRLASALTGGGDLGGAQVVAVPDGVWIAYATGMMGAVEYRSAKDLSMVVGPQSGHTNGIRVFVGGGVLWLVDGGAGRLECADPRSGTIDASSQETLPAAVVADANGSYLGDDDGVGFLRPDPACPH